MRYKARVTVDIPQVSQSAGAEIPFRFQLVLHRSHPSWHQLGERRCNFRANTFPENLMLTVRPGEGYRSGRTYGPQYKDLYALV